MNMNFRDLNFRLYGVILLILAVSFSPRISLPLDIPGRVFDLRAEDIVIAGLLCGWLCYLMLRPRIYKTPLFIPVVIYLLIVILTTLVNAADKPTNFPKNFIYVLKDLQYILIFFLIANWIRTRSEMENVFRIFLIAGGFNVCWVLIQLLFEIKSPLFGLNISIPKFPGHENRQVIYTASLIGEFSMLSASLYFAFLSFLSYSAYLLWPSRNRFTRNLFLGFGFLLTASSVVVGVKISIVVFFVGVFALSVLRGKAALLIWAISLIGLMTFVISLMIHIFGDGVSIEGFPIHRIIHWKSYLIGEDRLEIWSMIMPQLINSFLLGVGKGGNVMINGMELRYEESHNHYIKLIVESGFYGFLAFMFLLIRIGMMTISVFKNSTYLISKIISSSALCTLLGLCVAAIVQDAFKPVLPNEIFWIFTGLTAAAYRIEKFHNGRHQEMMATT